MRRQEVQPTLQKEKPKWLEIGYSGQVEVCWLKPGPPTAPSSFFAFSLSPSHPPFCFWVPVVFALFWCGSMPVQWEIQIGAVFVPTEDFSWKPLAYLLINNTTRKDHLRCGRFWIHHQAKWTFPTDPGCQATPELQDNNLKIRAKFQASGPVRKQEAFTGSFIHSLIYPATSWVCKGERDPSSSGER